MLFKRCCACCGTRRRQSRSNKVKVTFKDESDAGQGRRRRRRRATYRYEVVYHHEENLRNDYLDPLPRLADSSAVPDPRGLPPAAGLNPLCPSYSHLSNYGNINDYSTQSLVWQLPQDHYKSPRHCLATQVPEQVSKDPVNYSVHLRPLPLSLGAEGTEFGASAELNRGFGNTDCTFHTIEHFKALEKSGKLQRLLQEKYLRVPELPEGSFGSPGSFPAASSPLGDSGSTLLLGSSPGSEIIRQRNRSSAEEMNSRANIDFQNPPGDSRNGVPASPGYREGSFGILGQLSEEELGPLPENWEKACTERGEAYFIDHNTGTSQWLDPRLSKVQKKSLDECTEDELPYGWEKIDDPHYGTYYIDHVNRKTQYENPVLEARKETVPTVTNPETDGRNGTIPRTKKTQQFSGNTTRENKTAPRKSKYLLRSYFTRNPAELKGERIFTTLVKLNRGLGFTVIGGDDSDEEFLQIKSVVPNGPAWVDGRLQSGDILVYVNNQCVLGFTHQDMVNMFQAISPGEAVSLEVCRGYPLPFDPDDPNTEIVTTVAVSSSSSDQQQQQAFLRPEENLAEAEFITVQILKGSMGFGFTIADSSSGQKVKTILDTARCKNLQEGDVLIDINGVSMQNLSHAEVVQHLKDCPLGQEASITIQRGGGGPVPSKNRWKKGKEGPPVPRKPQMGTVPGGLYRSKTPTADLYSMQPKEVVPSRSKTPLVDTRNRSKTPTFGLDYYDRDAMDNELRFLERAYGRYPTNGSVQFQPKGSRDVDYANRGLVEFQSQDSGYETGFNGPVRTNQQSLVDGQVMGTNQGPARDFADPRLAAGLGGNLESDWLEMTVTLFRHESGFGFRIVGGTEEGSQVSIGHIVPGGAADMDGRLRSGDEIVSVDGQSVAHTSHHHVVQLMGAAALSGKVTLGIRRFTDPHRINPAAYDGQGRNDPVYPYDVTVNRTEKEGFGFVIISSVTKSMSFIGQILRGSPAERCSRLHVGDRILAVNQRDISQMHHGDIVNLIKDSGYSVTLTVGPPADDSSSTTSNSQRNEDVAMVTAQAMLAPTADTSSLLQTSNGFVPHTDATDAPFMQEGSDGLGGEFYAVELKRGNRGFGFSIRGGSEFQMPIFVLRIAEDGPAAAVQTMRAGDYLIEINGLSTHNLTHADAIERIKQGGPVVRLLLQRQQQQMQQLQQQTYNSATINGDRMLSPITAPSADSPFIPDTLPPTTSMAHLHQAPNHSTPNGTAIPPPSAMTTPTALPPANHRASGRFQGPTKPRPLGNPASGDYYWRS